MKTRAHASLPLLALGAGLAAFAPLPARAETWSIFRSENDHVTEGNERMAAGDFKAALESYDLAARELPSDGGVHLNRGIALLKSGDSAKAREALKLAVQSKSGPSTRADANYNLGLAFYKEGDAAAGKDDHAGAQRQFREAADSFKQALRLRPGDRNAAWNYELAQRRIREQKEKQEQKEQSEKDEQKPEQDQGEQDPNQEPQDGEQGEPGEPNDEPKQADDPQAKKPEEPKQEGPKPEPEKPEQPPQAQPQEQQAQAQPQPAQPRSESERALDALQDGEENLERMKAMRRAARERRVPDKDW